MQFSEQSSPAYSIHENQSKPSLFFSLFDKEVGSQEQFVPILTQTNYKLIEEEPPEDDSDIVFDYDLLLPPPNPLPLKSPTPREPLKVIFDYKIW